jgi:hypothetical protein
MYYLTGLPGWMRFGFSPGWVGRSPSGLGPCAQFMMTGQWPTPQMQAAWTQMQAGGPMPGPWGMGMPYGMAAGMGTMDPQQELYMLKSQSQMLSDQLEQINTRIAELEKQAG